MSNSFFQGVRDVRAQRPIGFIGHFNRTHDYRSVTGINTSPQTAQVSTIKVSAATAGTRVVRVDALTVQIEVEGNDKAVQAAAIADALNRTPGVRRVAFAESDGVDTVALTGGWPGVPFDLSTADANLTVATVTQAAEADPMGFGLAVLHTGTAEDEVAPLIALPKAARFTAQVQTHTVTSGADAIFAPVVRSNGQTYNGAPVQHTTSATATATAIAASINAAMPPNTVLAAGSGANVVLTAEVPGAEFDAEILSVGAAAGSVVKANTAGPSPATSLRRALLGITTRRLDLESATVGGPGEYHGNSAVEVATRGVGVVERDLAESWARGASVYVGTGSDDAGRLYSTAGAGRVWLGTSPIVIERGEHSTTRDGLGVVRIDMGA